MHPIGQFHALFERQQHLSPAHLLGSRNRVHAREMKNRLAPMILADPKGRYFVGLRLPASGGGSQIHLLHVRQALGEVRQQLDRDLALVSARTQYSRHGQAAMLCVAQSSRISRVYRLRNFIPAAPSSVRTAFAVRPWRPITLPRSSGWTRSSRMVACCPSTDLTRTSSG